MSIQNFLEKRDVLFISNDWSYFGEPDEVYKYLIFK